ncbi:MAG: GNAT family N-acetyltransferase, partial [bacterium]|nr:GNAT family N-acetyltransferase [bacterium]
MKLHTQKRGRSTFYQNSYTGIGTGSSGRYFLCYGQKPERDNRLIQMKKIRPAKPQEAEFLTELAMRSKAHWGYPETFMEACRAELSMTPEWIETHPVFVMDEGNTITGFYSLEEVAGGTVELGHLFIEPMRLRGGIGRQLVKHAIREARNLGFHTLQIQGDPNAEGFYLSCGAS